MARTRLEREHKARPRSRASAATTPACQAYFALLNFADVPLPSSEGVLPALPALQTPPNCCGPQ
eukprot:1371739-Alexandrium_andersonii.AAC.1